MSTPASPFVSPDHWSYHVLQRFDYAGLLPPGSDIARRSMPQEEIAALLAHAAHPAAAKYFERFRAEFSASKIFDASLQAGYVSASDVFAPGIGFDSANWSGARAVNDISRAFAGGRLALSVTDWLAVAIANQNANLAELQVTAGYGIAGAWAGKRELGFSVGNSGGLAVMRADIEGGGVFLTRPLQLPWLGSTRFEMHISRIDNVLNINDTQRDIEPWFWTARGSIEPLRNLRIGISRGMMFGGEGNLPVTFERVAKNIIGIYTDDGESSFANQNISVDFRYRLPFAPVTAYLDWGSDDAAGGWWDVPGILAGIQAVHLDPMYDISVGLEHTQLSGACCGNSVWYRNAWFRGSWADGDAGLGHPLGGHGREWRVFGHGGFANNRITAHAAVYARRRRDQNIFVPAWQGKSTGLRAGGDVQLTTRGRLLFEVETESGADDWSTTRASAAVKHRF